MSLAQRLNINFGIRESDQANDGIVAFTSTLSSGQANGKGTISILCSISEDMRLNITGPGGLSQNIDGPNEDAQFFIPWDGSVTPADAIVFSIITLAVFSAEAHAVQADIAISSPE